MGAGNISQFLGAQPIGSKMEAPYGIADPNWLKMDGSIINRAFYPTFSANCGTVGTFTPTIRAAMPTGISTNNNISSNGTNLICSTTGNGLAAIAFSTNGGVSWSNATSGLTTSATFLSTTLAGTNFVAATNSGFSQPVYAAAANPGVWTQASGIPLANGVTPQIAANPLGVVVLLFNTAAYLSTNGGASYSISNGMSIPGPASPPIVWSGTQFIVFSPGANGGTGIQTSPTGASGTWTTNTLTPWGGSFPISSACSDGTNNVLVVSFNSAVAWASKDGGITWHETLLPQPAGGPVSYANGRFFVPQAIMSGVGSWLADGSVAVSSDLNTWFSVPNFAVSNTNGNTASTTTVGYAQGNYVAVNAQYPATPYTCTENTSQMYLPTSRRNYPYTTNLQEWIKVQ